MERQQDYVLRTVEERGVRHIRLWFSDVLGQLKSVETSPAELEMAFEEGMQFDGSAIDGYSRVQESDVLAFPDANSFELLPWGIDDAAFVRTMGTWARTHKRLVLLAYFNSRPGSTWDLHNKPKSAAAYRKYISTLG